MLNRSMVGVIQLGVRQKSRSSVEGFDWGGRLATIQLVMCGEALEVALRAWRLNSAQRRRRSVRFKVTCRPSPLEQQEQAVPARDF